MRRRMEKRVRVARREKAVRKKDNESKRERTKRRRRGSTGMVHVQILVASSTETSPILEESVMPLQESSKGMVTTMLVIG